MSSNIDAMKRILSKSRLLLLMENERIQNEINVMEVLVDELKQLIKRTNGFINQQKLTLETREFHLKTSENISVALANRILKSLPDFPERSKQRPKILDKRLMNFLFTEGYIRSNFVNLTDENVELQVEPQVIVKSFYFQNIDT